MSARLATAWSQTSLIPRGREGYRRWRSGSASGVRVVATSRSHSPEVQALASRIFGGPAFPSYESHDGTVYGRVSTLTEDTKGWRITETLHGVECLACIRHTVSAIAQAAVTGSVGATYGTDRPMKGHWELEEGEEMTYEKHLVTVSRVVES